MASVLAVAGAGYLGVLGYTASQPLGSQPTETLAGWLVAHRLTSGLAGYWVANVTSLGADGRVRLAPVITEGTAGYAWESQASWYDPAVSSANFVVVTSPFTADNPRSRVVRAFYGEPARTYHFQNYTIMVYDHNLLRLVRAPTT